MTSFIKQLVAKDKWLLNARLVQKKVLCIVIFSGEGMEV